ncbi:hypothetical protein H6P81_003126 [Aristolochia fimbriata]|uniref:Aminotransferase-like plant mobile domain-containing protein n=1 Tax=Aristolochia fimbriata TaxID=158543 RepID=A0AAV7FBX1_ARIFI|nr:hypothetical protein H6P81_003126 [Aristolochia fimbriata]
MRWIVEEVWKMWVEPAELLWYTGGQAPAEGDERVEGPIVQFIPEEREPNEDANDNSSGEESWPDPVTAEVEEKEEVQLPLPTMGVPPLEENDVSYPDPWIGVMDMNATYTNTMVPGEDDDNVPPPVGVGISQRFMTKDALQMYLKDYCIRRHVQFKERYSVKDLDKMVWRCASAETVAHYDHAIQNLEEACPGARAELTEDMSPEQWALVYDGNMQEKAAQITTHLCPSVDAHLQTVVEDARHVYVVPYGDGIFQAGEHKVMMADTPLLYDQDSHRSEAIWHGEDPGCLECPEHFQTLRHWPVDEWILLYIEAAGFSALHRVQWLRLDKPLITAVVERWRSETNTFHLANAVGMGTSTYWTSDTPRGTGAAGWPFRFQVKWQPYLDFMQRLPAMCVEGRRIWLSKTPLICFEIVELHAPDRVMLQFGLEQLGCVRNMVERVNHRAALYPSSIDPHWLDIGHYCQSVLHSLPLLEGAIVDGDVSHAGEPSHVVEPARDRAPRERRARRWPTAEMTTRVESSDEVPAVLEPTVLDLPPEQTPDLEPDQPLVQPLEQHQEPEPSRHPPIRRI